MAEKKGRSLGGAWCLAFLCGPVAISIVAMLPEQSGEDRNKQGDQSMLILGILGVFLAAVAAFIW